MQMHAQKRALDKIYKRRDRYEIPDWQREEVWSDLKKRKLIDTVLRGWKLPKFYFLKTSESPEEFEVLDGQQRLTAIWEFIDGDLTLSDKTASEFGGATYRELPDDVSDAFDDYEIEYDEIFDASEEDQKEYFQRLQEGLSLTGSERLNAVHSKLRDYARKLEKHPFFSENTVISKKRYAYFDILSKVFALEIEGLDSGTRFEEVKEVFLSNSNFSPKSATAKRVKAALDLLAMFTEKPTKRFRNRTIVQSVITLVCHLEKAGLDQSKMPIVSGFLDSFLTRLSEQVELGHEATDSELITFQRTVNANVRSGAKTRNDILLKRLFQTHPDIYDVFSDNTDMRSLIQKEIDEKARAIGDLITKINDVYAAKSGDNLFKPTNKTMSVLAGKLKEPITDFDGYKTLIENLYFLFREGVGNRLGDEIPASFREVNDLRTQIEHDVEHGKKQKISKKKKELAEVFERISGGKSPETLEPEKFSLTQANLFSHLVSDLRQLLIDLNK